MMKKKGFNNKLQLHQIRLEYKYYTVYRNADRHHVEGEICLPKVEH